MVILLICSCVVVVWDVGVQYWYLLVLHMIWYRYSRVIILFIYLLMCGRSLGCGDVVLTGTAHDDDVLS